MIRAAVIGSPINHSLSPALHLRGYEVLGIEGRYEAFEVSSGQLESFLQAEGKGLSGLSLTMPLKEEALEVTEKISDDAKLLRSINTLVRINSLWEGFNTDLLGFQYLLRELAGDQVTILGAGGTARAALLAAKRQGMTSFVVRRNSARDEALKMIDSSVKILSWGEISQIEGFGILINATPRGALPKDIFFSQRIILDSLYDPWPTELSKLLPEHDLFLTGIDLLAAQASYQIELMVGTKIDHNWLIPELKRHALARINSVD